MVLLWNAFRTQEQLKSATDLRLIASSVRKATAVGDFVAERRNGVAELAERHEIETYLINKALGMSPRYGLNANLDAVEERFRHQVAQKTVRGEPIYNRIVLFDENGETLVDIAPGEPAIHLPPDFREGTTLGVDPAHKRIVATAPVMYRGNFSGTIAAVGELEQLSRYLVSSETQDQYREVLLTLDGRELPALGQHGMLDAAYTRSLAALPENRLVAVDATVDGHRGGAGRQATLAVRTPISGVPLSLVTILPEDQIYGHITSRLFLFSAAAFPLVVLFAAILFDRMRRRTLRLQAAFAESDRRRFELQGRNVALSEEIERREAVERELREKSTELEAMAADLRASMLRAEEANLAKTRFLATVSHEIRTPMNGVLGMAQRLLQSELTQDERQGYVRTILSSGQTLLTLLNDILDLSKVEAGKLELIQSLFDPVQILEETAALFAESAQRKGLKIEVGWHGPESAGYWGDPVRLRQMLSNLASNAVKFTDAGCIRIEASESERDAAQAVLEFRVSDSGAGVPPHKQSMLFQPFTQVDDSSTRKFGGTGLGLSIVRSLAQMMGGDVGVQSAEGQGSRFWFRIRAAVMAEGFGARSAGREIAAGRGSMTAAQVAADPVSNVANSRPIPAGADVRPLETGRVVPLVREVEVLLERRKFRAVSRFQALQAQVAGTGVSADFEAIGRLVADFRFEEALGRLRHLASAHGWIAG